MRNWKAGTAIGIAASLFVTLLMPGAAGYGRASAEEAAAPTSNMRTVSQFSPYAVIEDFESDGAAAGWQAGENAAEVGVAEQAWNVFFPYEGARFLAIKSIPNLQNNVWRTAFRSFAEPLDLSDSRYLMMAYDHFGYLPNDEPYYAKLKVYSGASSTEGIVRVFNNQWNKIGIDLSGWAGRSAIDKLEVGFLHAYDRADYPDDPLPDWPNTEFYVDYIHAANVLDWQFSYEGDTEGWTFAGLAAAPEVSGGKLTIVPAGAEATMTSAPLLLDTAGSNVVTVKLANGSAVSGGKLYWTTEEEPLFDEAKSRELIPAAGAAGTFEAKLIGHAKWTGQATGLRLRLTAGGTGAIAIDGIDLSKQDRPTYEYIGEVTGVRVDESRIEVTGALEEEAESGEARLQLYELAPYEYEPDIAALQPVAETAAPSGPERGFSIAVPRFDGQRDRYYSKYIVVLRENGGDGEAHYVDAPKSVADIAFPAARSFPYPQIGSKKGLNVQMTDDAEELGVAHATLTVVVNGLMYKDNVDPDNAISFSSDGETYYFRRDAVVELDREIKAMSDNGTVVNLVLILYDADDPNGSTGVLIHPDAARGQGTVYAFNTTDAEGVAYFRTAMEFLADRYTREDQQYGRAMGYIVGNEVDSAWIWQNMGDKTVDQFVEQYERSVRLAYQAVRKYSDSARVYVSIDNAWNEPYFANQPTRFYKGKDIVDKLNVLSKRGGDYPWHLAHHPYPENMLEPRTWNDSAHVTDTDDSPKITFKNLEVLDRYLGREELRYGGERRRIILSEQGFHTQADTLEAEKIQAAAYAYAYYKALFLDGVDAFIMFNQLDIPAAGLNMGLWTANTELPGFVAKDKKFIYDVFRDIDTARSLDATGFAKPIIGIQDWAEVVPGFDPAALAQRIPAKLVPVAINAHSPNDLSGDRFEAGTDGWEPADHAEAVVRTTTDAYLGSGALKVDFVDLVRMTFVGLERLWKGAEKKFASPVDATAKPRLNVAVKLTDPVATQAYYAKVRVYGGTRIAEGIARIDASKGWNALSLDLSDWEGKSAIDRIKVWTRKTTDDSWSGSLLIDDVGFSKHDRSTGGLLNVDMAASVSDLASLAPGSTVEVEVANYDGKKLSGDIQVEGIGQISFQERKLKLKDLRTGETQRFTLKVASYDPQAAGKIGVRFKYRDTVQDTVLRTDN